jgi:hypothetical protein
LFESKRREANMRRVLVIVLAFMLLASAGAFAARGGGFGIGGEGSVYFAGTGGLPVYAMLTLHFPRFPLYFGIGVTQNLDIGFTADYWFTHGGLGSIFDYYVGIGGYLALSPNAGAFAGGARLPIGLQMWPFGSVFEIFLEFAPALGVSFVPTGFDWHLQGAIGFRFWF